MPSSSLPLPAAWQSLAKHCPTWLAGLTGRDQQFTLLDRALSTTPADASEAAHLHGSAVGLAFWALAERPLDPLTTGLCLMLHRQANMLDDASAHMLERLATAVGAGRTDHAATTPALEQAEREGDMAAIAGATRLALLRPPQTAPPLFWLGRGWEALLATGGGGKKNELAGHLCELLEVADGAGLLEDFAPVRARLGAQAALYADDEQALQALDPLLDNHLLSNWARYASAGALTRLDEERGARRELRSLLAHCPWHTDALLWHHALGSRPDYGPAFSPAVMPETVVCLYTWNNADGLTRALGALARSRLHGARIVVLNNGATDHTAHVIEQFARSYEGGLTRLATPVNIGAPAARNWLLAHPGVQQAEHVVFLDDDALVAPDWLEVLTAEAVADPDCGAVGTRVVDDTDAPCPLVQKGPIFFEQTDDDSIHVLDPLGDAPDSGPAMVSRRCLSVTGCCHLLTRMGREAASTFDIRFTPSQVDDLERDLRMVLGTHAPEADGPHCRYAGRAVVRHLRRSGTDTFTDPVRLAALQAHTQKLAGLYGPAQVAALRTRGYELASADIAEAQLDLSQKGTR